MPIYTYVCPKHEDPVERMVPMSEAGDPAAAANNQRCEVLVEGKPCSEKLTREEIPMTARTPDKWTV